MPEQPTRRVPDDYDRNVFINCPFDAEYLPLFRALIFAVFACGLVPRCAQEVYDAGDVRIEKIVRLIRICRWGIHDISRTELNARGLPRFNMPLELGLFLGARRFGAGEQRLKSSLVLDREPYRYQQFISDIAGQDVTAHSNDPAHAIRAVRDWLRTSKAALPHPRGGAVIAEWFATFMTALPNIASKAKLEVSELTFVEFADMASTWLAGEM